MIKMREANKKDLPQIKELNWKFFIEELPYDELFKANEESKIWGRRFVDRTFRNRKWKYFVADDNGKIIGVMSGKLDRYPQIFKKNSLGYLFISYVLPQYRKQGIGRKLLNKILTWLKSKRITVIETDVYVKNPYARVWEKFGFKEIYKRMRLKI